MLYTIRMDGSHFDAVDYEIISMPAGEILMQFQAMKALGNPHIFDKRGKEISESELKYIISEQKKVQKTALSI